jgi:hypothetical protein
MVNYNFVALLMSDTVCTYKGRQKKTSHHLNVSVEKALITHLDFDVTQK